MRQDSGFSGGVFHDSIPGGRSGARIEVTPAGLRAETHTNHVFELAFAELQLELGGATGRMLFCRDASRTLTIFSEERGFIYALTSVAGRAVQDQLAPINDQLRRQRLGNLVMIGVALALVAGLVLAGPALVHWGVLSAMDSVPRDVDAMLGQVAAHSMDL